MVVKLVINPGSEPISGRIRKANGDEVAFTGLLQLLPVIEQLREGERLGGAPLARAAAAQKDSGRVA